METQRPDAAKPRDIIEFLREEQSRRQSETPKPRWLVELLEEANKPFSEEKQARLNAAIRRAKELRARMKSLAPETTESIIRQMRDGAS